MERGRKSIPYGFQYKQIGFRKLLRMKIIRLHNKYPSTNVFITIFSRQTNVCVIELCITLGSYKKIALEQFLHCSAFDLGPYDLGF